MYGTLGFVENDRHIRVTRDSAYLGTSGHPSRKEYSGARRPEEEVRLRLQQERKERCDTPAPSNVAMPLPSEKERCDAPASMAPDILPRSIPSAPIEGAMMQRRCEFLEAQDKRHMAEVADLRRELAEARYAMDTLSERTFTVTGEALRTTPSRKDVNGAPGASSGEVHAGERLRLIYPMHRDGDEVWMRRLVVGAKTAAFGMEWVLLFKDGSSRGAPDELHVSHFL